MSERSRRGAKSNADRLAEYKRVRAGGNRSLKVREMWRVYARHY